MCCCSRVFSRQFPKKSILSYHSRWFSQKKDQKPKDKYPWRWVSILHLTRNNSWSISITNPLHSLFQKYPLLHQLRQGASKVSYNSSTSQISTYHSYITFDGTKRNVHMLANLIFSICIMKLLYQKNALEMQFTFQLFQA